MIRCFSLQENYSKLIQVIPEQEFMLIHIYKVIATIAVMMLHRFFFSIPYTHYSAHLIEEVSSINFSNSEPRDDHTNISPDCTFQAAHASRKGLFYFSLDVSLFFFISGILLFEGFSKTKRNDWLDPLEKIIRRWLR